MSRRPNARDHNPDPIYLRKLIAQTGLNQAEIAKQLGVRERAVRRWLAPLFVKSHIDIPYVAQYALESLAHFEDKQHA